ncbi:MAG: hypothetical protein Q9172_004858, partial [Xanthocarpia lactea]
PCQQHGRYMRFLKGGKINHTSTPLTDPKMYEFFEYYHRWERWRTKYKIKICHLGHDRFFPANPRRPLRKERCSDSRIISDIKYMQQHGLTLKEARRIPYTRPWDSASTMWHDWKHEEYMHAVINSRDDRDLLSLDLDGGADGDTDSSVVPPLARLPPELLDLIISFLPKGAELTLRLACPALCYRYGSQTIFSLMCNLRIDPDLTVRQRSRWIFNSWLQRLPHRMPESAFLPCFPCGAQHSRFWFSRKETWNRSGTRACLGWTRRLYLSPRHSVTVQQLLGAAQEGWEVARRITTTPSDICPEFNLRLDGGSGRAYNPRITDDDDDNTAQPEDGHPPSPSALEALQQDSSSDGPSISAVKMSWYEPNGHSHCCVMYPGTFPSYRLEYDIHFPLPKLRLGLPPLSLSQSTKKYLGEHRFGFCPHLRSDDPAFEKKVGQLFEEGWSDLFRCRIRVTCQRCNTCVAPALKMGLGDERVLVVRVHRNLGDLNSGLDSVLLMHLM